MEMTKSFGVHSDSEKFDICRNRKRTGSMLFIFPKGDDFCSADAGRNKIPLPAFTAIGRAITKFNPCKSGIVVWCIISKGQSSFPGPDKVTWTSSGFLQTFRLSSERFFSSELVFGETLVLLCHVGSPRAQF